jgi:heme exporter protein A
MYSLVADNLGKRFGSRKVLSEISFELKTGDSLAIVGDNGSGKSTLVMLLLGYYHATKGKISFSREGTRLDDARIRSTSSLVSPYLNLYDNLTAEENLVFFSTVAGDNVTGKRINALLDLVGLEGRGGDPVASYSSGMKQRLKYAVAMLNEPSFLFLDEPTSNLDESGKQIVKGIIEDYRSRAIIIVATNEKEEYSLASQLRRLGQ